MKAKVFVASSVEGLDIANQIQVNLQHEADLTIWSQGVFSLSTTPLDSITNALINSDFGIFVFSPDDETKMRGSVNDTVRDNVIFELGLFIGRLSKKRCFIVMPDNVDLHIPSDLIGVTPATYSGTRHISEIAASLGPACHEITKAMKTQGVYSRNNKSSSKIPANEFDSNDENDKITILESWLIGKNDADGIALTYQDIDNKLKLESGTAKRLLPSIIQNHNNYDYLAGFLDDYEHHLDSLKLDKNRKYRKSTKINALNSLWLYTFKTPLCANFEDYWYIDIQNDSIAGYKTPEFENSLSGSEKFMLGIWRSQVSNYKIEFINMKSLGRHMQSCLYMFLKFSNENLIY